ncbi:hypothetical protein I317_06283 [Kwoniella heveanensis CBS 569]|uniref:Uncharacterized protein n=1 Tax=Kwoniella heveanensis BCC8398 TaxID=1296120 RepID=A0A1B9GV82_9TREE|nr:hypothetical protein I316_03496 [Kwoniella heveanensis BCC8398]OCF39909.1 hypothetical protein I317_06283 [Kwoniella heveanensis CBS 569]
MTTTLNPNANIFSPSPKQQGLSPLAPPFAPPPTLQVEPVPELVQDTGDSPISFFESLPVTPRLALESLPAFAIEEELNLRALDDKLHSESKPQGLGLDISVEIGGAKRDLDGYEELIRLNEAFYEAADESGYLGGISDRRKRDSSVSEDGRTWIIIVDDDEIDDAWPAFDLESLDVGPYRPQRFRKEEPRVQPVMPSDEPVPAETIRPTAIRWADTVEVKVCDAQHIPKGVHQVATKHLTPATLPKPGPSILRKPNQNGKSESIKLEYHKLPSLDDRPDPQVLGRSKYTHRFTFPIRLDCLKPNSGRTKRPMVGSSQERRDPPSEQKDSSGPVPEPRRSVYMRALKRAFRKKDRKGRRDAKLARDEEEERRARLQWEGEVVERD